MPRSELSQERRRAARVMAKGVVEAHDDLACAENAREHLLHEGFSLHARELERERDDQSGVGPEALHAPKVFLEGGDGHRRALRPQHGRGIWVERAHDRGQAEGAGPLDGRRDEPRVREMDAVEGAQRRHAGAEVRRVGLEAAKDPHGGVVRA